MVLFTNVYPFKLADFSPVKPSVSVTVIANIGPVRGRFFMCLRLLHMLCELETSGVWNHARLRQKSCKFY